MDMGSAEVTMTQIPSIAPPASSSYYLQLDPSGHVDILDSSLALNKPDMAEETVYEIQLDPYVMDERNIEIINMQNLQNLQNLQNFQNIQNLQNLQTTFTFQPELIETLPQQQFSTTLAYEPQQFQFQIDDPNLSQMLLANNVTILPAPPQPPPPAPMETVSEKTEIFEEVAFVPEFVVESEIIGDPSKECPETFETTQSQSHVTEPKNNEADSQIEDVTENNGLNIPGGSKSDEGSESETSTKASKVSYYLELLEKTMKPKVFKTKKRFLPDKVMEFSEEPALPPLVELFPTPEENKRPPPSPTSPPVVTISDEEEDENLEIEWNTERTSSSSESRPLVHQFLHDSVDPDDELYISFQSRPDETKTVMCVLCYDWFETMPDLESHLKSTHQDNMKLYGCKKCGQQFWSRFLRQRHEKTHRYDLKGPIERYFPKNRPFDHYEPKHYLKRLRPAPLTEGYRDHLKQLHIQIKSMEYECIVCQLNFRNEEEYREHYEEEHAVQTCIHCRKAFENSKLLRKHELEAHGKITFKKNYSGGAWKLWKTWECDEMKEKDEHLVNLYLYHNYSKRMKTDDQQTSAAKNCDNFGNMECEEITVSVHEASKMSDKRKSDKPRRSKSSGKSKGKKNSKLAQSSPSKNSDHNIKVEVTEHAPDSATNENLPFKCEQCKTSYESEVELQRHLKTHTIRSMAYMCQYCGRGFATHSNRKEHERIHTGDKPYVCPSKSHSCPICARAFVQISNLKKHIQTHKDKNNLQCSTCNKQFVKESSLILHQRAHSQDRKFRCHICDRAYNYASLLKRHMRIHTGENPYSCEDCGMLFHELVSLHYHRKKVHTGERPHRCPKCARAFILSSDLKKHLKIHEREDDCLKPTATKTYSRKPKPPTQSIAVISSGPESMSSTPIDSNGTNSQDFLDQKPVEDNVDSQSHVAIHTETNVPMKPATFNDVNKDDDDDEEGGLVINETNLLNLAENSETTTDGVITSQENETNEKETHSVTTSVITVNPLSTIVKTDEPKPVSSVVNTVNPVAPIVKTFNPDDTTVVNSFNPDTTTVVNSFNPDTTVVNTVISDAAVTTIVNTVNHVSPIVNTFSPIL